MSKTGVKTSTIPQISRRVRDTLARLLVCQTRTMLQLYMYGTVTPRCMYTESIFGSAQNKLRKMCMKIDLGMAIYQ